MSSIGSLGRRAPTDWAHVSKYPMTAVLPRTVVVVNRLLTIPRFRPKMDQGQSGSCVGWSLGWVMAFLNRHYYDGWSTYKRALQIDEWPGNEGDMQFGTSVRAGFEVLRTQGPERVIYSSAVLDFQGFDVTGEVTPPTPAAGIAAYRWATSMDEIRSSIAAGIPVELGIPWYSKFSQPTGSPDNYWIGKGTDWGSVVGGHAICLYGARDDRQAVRLANTWGSSWPLVWMPYTALERLLGEWGEAGLVTDR